MCRCPQLRWVTWGPRNFPQQGHWGSGCWPLKGLQPESGLPFLLTHLQNSRGWNSPCRSAPPPPDPASRLHFLLGFTSPRPLVCSANRLLLTQPAPSKGSDSKRDRKSKVKGETPRRETGLDWSGVCKLLKRARQEIFSASQARQSLLQ